MSRALKQESSIAETIVPNVSQAKSRSKLFSDSVDRILYAVESRSDNAIGGGKRRGHICYGGQLTESDLHHLSLLCSSIDNDDQSLDVSEPLHFVTEHDSSDDFSSLATVLSGWASVDVDTISALTFLLEEHVTSAIVVDLVGEVRRIFEDRNDNLEQINEVRFTFLRCLLMSLSIAGGLIQQNSYKPFFNILLCFNSIDIILIRNQCECLLVVNVLFLLVADIYRE